MPSFIHLDDVSKVYETEGGAVEACLDVSLDIGQSITPSVRRSARFHTSA